jgi:hypothetical protein
MDSAGYVDSVEQKLKPFAPVLISNIIKKQLNKANASRETLTPRSALVFIENVTDALEMFLGPQGKLKVKTMMMNELRKFAPEHFQNQEV